MYNIKISNINASLNTIVLILLMHILSLNFVNVYEELKLFVKVKIFPL